jgi:membrane-associated phospholipid phosphatase
MNETLFERVNAFARATPWLHPVMTAYAGYGVVVFAALLLAGWWTARRAGTPEKMAAALLAGASTLIAVAVNQPIVAAVHEARPYAAHPGILVLAHRSTDPSFPSDHATMAGAVAVGLWLVSRRLGVTAALFALLMAFARVYIAAHYPGDVLAGLLLGGMVALVVYLLARRPATRLVGALGRTRVRPLLLAGGQLAGDPGEGVRRGTGAPEVAPR